MIERRSAGLTCGWCGDHLARARVGREERSRPARPRRWPLLVLAGGDLRWVWSLLVGGCKAARGSLWLRTRAKEAGGRGYAWADEG